MSFIQQFYQDCLLKFALMGETPHLINVLRGYTGIRRSIMATDIALNPAPRLASES